MTPMEAAALTGADQPSALRMATYFSSERKQVRGFLTDGAAAVMIAVLKLQAEQGIFGHMAEIGTYHGKTFIGLALALRNEERLLGVDIFEERGSDFEPSLRANYRAFGIPDEKIRLHRGPSTGLNIPQWQALVQGPARFIHVDGDHTRKAVYHDLTLAASSLVPGAVILVDDVFHPWFPDVTLGLLDFLSHEQDLSVVALIDRQGPLINGGPKMLLSKRSDFARYRKILIEQMRPNIVREATFDRHRILVMSFDQGVTWPKQA